jgi:hypothetical protein
MHAGTTIRRALGLAAAALALSASPSLAQEDDGFRFPPGTDPGRNAALSISSVDSLNVVLAPADLAQYDRLIGRPIRPAETPADPEEEERPLIDFKVHRVSGGIMETWVDLRAQWCGRQGWFNNATAVDNPALYAISRGTGYPKIIADRITLAEQPDGTVVGEVRQLGKSLIKLTWRPASDAEIDAALEAEPWRAKWLEPGRAYAGKSWTFEPVADLGPFVKEVSTEEVKPTTWDSRVGMVTVEIAQDANPILTNGDWMSLVPETVEVPGMLEEARGEVSFYGESFQCGLQGSTISGPPTGATPQPPAVPGSR